MVVSRILNIEKILKMIGLGLGLGLMCCIMWVVLVMVLFRCVVWFWVFCMLRVF